MSDSRFIRRVQLKNYKSIAACDVELSQLMFLVGPNGSGKSNFLDAFRFVSDALRTSLDHAIRDRGGIKEVRRRSGGHPTHFAIRFDFRLPDGVVGHYGFRIGARSEGGYEVQDEICVVHPIDALTPTARYRAQRGRVSGTIASPPPALPDRLYLVTASGLPEFRPVYDAFSRMGFYNLNPDRIRDPQATDQGELLARDGGNVASVLRELGRRDAATKSRIEEYLAKVVPGVHGVDSKTIGPMETLEFRQDVVGSSNPWRFPAGSMSDGTLRALAILVALLQSANNGSPDVPLVGIEEPEIALHPAAVGAILDALQDASAVTQVLVTSHSPDLLDDDRLDTSSILAVMAHEGATSIGQLDDVGRTALRDHLYTAGELLRLDQLVPDPEAVAAAAGKQLNLLEDDLQPG